MIDDNESPHDVRVAFTFDGCIESLESLEVKIAELDEMAKEARALQKYLSDHLLNELLPDDVIWDKRKHTAKVSLTNSDRVVTLKKEMHCGVPKDSRAEAHAWLLDNGFEDLLKYEIVVSFPRNRLDSARSTMTMLQRTLDPDVLIDGDTELAGATMAAFVRARLNLGHHVPECFSVHTAVRIVKESAVEGSIA